MRHGLSRPRILVGPAEAAGMAPARVAAPIQPTGHCFAFPHRQLRWVPRFLPARRSSLPESRFRSAMGRAFLSAWDEIFVNRAYEVHVAGVFAAFFSLPWWMPEPNIGLGRPVLEMAIWKISLHRLRTGSPGGGVLPRESPGVGKLNGGSDRGRGSAGDGWNDGISI